MKRLVFGRVPSQPPSRGLIVACLALFLSAASPVVGAKALIITMNSQVAGDTISGHAPPAWAHSNLIAGSVNATDLAPEINSTLADVPSSIVYRADALLPQTYSTIGTAGDVTLEASCLGAGGVLFWFYATTPSGFKIDYSIIEADHQADPLNEHDQVIKSGNVTFAAGRQRFLVFRENDAGQFARLAGTFMFSIGSRVVQLDLNAVANFGNSGVAECAAVGTLMSAR